MKLFMCMMFGHKWNRVNIFRAHDTHGAVFEQMPYSQCERCHLLGSGE